MSTTIYTEPFPAEGRFAQMDESAIADPNINGEQFRLLARLNRYQGQNSEAWPAIRTLALDLGRSTDSVTRDLKQLAAAGWIEQTRRAGSTSLYRVKSLDAGSVSANFASARQEREEAAGPAIRAAKARRDKYERTKGAKSRGDGVSTDGDEMRAFVKGDDEVLASTPVGVTEPVQGGYGHDCGTGDAHGCDVEGPADEEEPEIHSNDIRVVNDGVIHQQVVGGVGEGGGALRLVTGAPASEAPTANDGQASPTTQACDETTAPGLPLKQWRYAPEVTPRAAPANWEACETHAGRPYGCTRDCA